MQTRRVVAQILAAAAIFCGGISAAHADSYMSKGVPETDVTFKDVQDGKLVVTMSNGREKTVPLTDIASMNLKDLKAFNDAEGKRDKPADAAKLYLEALRNASKTQRRFVQARALPSLDAAGFYADAMQAFIELYSNSPTAGIWELHPRNLPADGKSLYLVDAASAIAGRVNAVPFTRDPEAQKNLNGILLEIYNKQGNTAKAAEVAKILGIDVAPVPVPETGSTPPAIVGPTIPITGAGVADVDAAMAAKKWEQAVAAADSALTAQRDDATAIKLYTSRALALKNLNRLEEAAASYMRVAAYYPASTVPASEALFNAGDIQKALKHDDEAKRLGAEIESKYPGSAAAAKAEGAGFATKPRK